MIPAGVKVYGEGRLRLKPGDEIPAHLLTKNKKLKEVIDEKGKKYADRKAKGISARKVDEEKRQKAIKDRQAKKTADKKKLMSVSDVGQADDKKENSDENPVAGGANSTQPQGMGKK